MPAYAIGCLKASDWKWLRDYRPTTAALIEKHGGRSLVSGGEDRPTRGRHSAPGRTGGP
ncbi:MAG: DUF1330 domain-containing protein [Myxococcota bacterium]